MGQEGKVYLSVVARMCLGDKAPVSLTPQFSLGALAAAKAGFCCNLRTHARLCGQGWDSFVLHPFFLLMGKGEEGVGSGTLI